MAKKGSDGERWTKAPGTDHRKLQPLCDPHRFGNEDHIFYSIGRWPYFEVSPRRGGEEAARHAHHSRAALSPSTCPYPLPQNGQPVNGGVPQNASLKAHLAQVEADIEKAIPDPHFSGLAIIDWEAWRPLWTWNFDSLDIYQVRRTAVATQADAPVRRPAAARACRHFGPSPASSDSPTLRRPLLYIQSARAST